MSSVNASEEQTKRKRERERKNETHKKGRYNKANRLT